MSRRTTTTGHATNNSVEHPVHYNADPSGVECIEIVRHRDFPIGSAIKYLWRAGLKTDASISEEQKEIEDLEKAVWYIEDKIAFLKRSVALKVAHADASPTASATATTSSGGSGEI